IFCGNTTKSRNFSRSPKKSFLFFLIVYYPKISLSRTRRCIFAVFSALLISFKNLLKKIVFILSCTYNCSKSLK
ncbi:uncharacterized protein K460DRAFT_298028, partial [Cucurbitaria berberidis CBS 394.84]